MNSRSIINFRFCPKCNDIAPPRSSHCSVCGKCVFRMDHHCPMTGNCIGLRNHKYFICFLFWLILCCLHISISSSVIRTGSWQYWNAPYFSIDQNYESLDPNSAMSNCNVLVPILAILMGTHIFFLTRNETNPEFCDFLHDGNPYRSTVSDNIK